MITLINVLTGERRNLPDSTRLIYLGPPYAPGMYDVINGSPAPLAIVYDSVLRVLVPPQSRWSVSNNENLYSWQQVDHDSAAWTTASLARGLMGAGWAPPPPMIGMTLPQN